MSQRRFASPEYAAKKKRTRVERFFAKLGRIVPWERLVAPVAQSYPRSDWIRGPTFGVPRLLCMYCVHQWSSLADDALEDAQYDCQSTRDLVGIAMSLEPVLDAATLLEFRRLLRTSALSEAVFDEINAYLPEEALSMLAGTIVDATIIAAPGSTKNAKGEQLKAGVRAKTEHDFDAVKNLCSHRKVRDKGLAKNQRQLSGPLGIAKLVFAKRSSLGMQARGASGTATSPQMWPSSHAAGPQGGDALTSHAARCSMQATGG